MPLANGDKVVDGIHHDGDEAPGDRGQEYVKV